MKIARFTDGGHTRLGIVDGDEIIDVGSRRPVAAHRPRRRCSPPATSPASPPRRRRRQRVALADVRLEAPIALPPTFLAIGLNYAAHVDESGMDKPEMPVVFNKQITCVTGPFDPIEVPTVAPTLRRLRRRARRRDRHAVPQRAASTRHRQVVAGYLIVNDVSVRDWQRATPTMTMGKSWDTHGPIGPWLVTADEIADPHDLRIRTWVDDEVRQDASTPADDHQLLGAHRLLVDGVHVAARHDHRHGHAGRRRFRDEAAALPGAGHARAHRDRRHRVHRQPGRRPGRRLSPRFVELDAVAAGVVEERLASGAHRFRHRHLDTALEQLGDDGVEILHAQGEVLAAIVGRVSLDEMDLLVVADVEPGAAEVEVRAVVALT